MPGETKQQILKECPAGEHVPVRVKDEGLYCEKCGLDLEGELFSTKPEWRAYTTEEQRERSRVGLLR